MNRLNKNKQTREQHIEGVLIELKKDFSIKYSKEG